MIDIEKLRAARELVARPSGWTQDTWGRGQTGDPSPVKGQAVCWCAYGAIMEACSDAEDQEDILYEALRDAIGAGSCGPINWNDTPGRTQAEVVAAFDRAIVLAEAAQ